MTRIRGNNKKDNITLAARLKEAGKAVWGGIYLFASWLMKQGQGIISASQSTALYSKQDIVKVWREFFWWIHFIGV